MKIWITWVCVMSAAGGCASKPDMSDRAELRPNPDVVTDIEVVTGETTVSTQDVMARVTVETDPTYRRLIRPYLQNYEMALPEKGDGLLIVYQPWGFVSSAVRFIPGTPSGVLQKAGRNGPTSRETLSAERWAALVKTLTDGQFFSLPYRNGVMGMDGYSLYVEARVNGTHHRVCHWVPDAAVLQLLRQEVAR